MRYVITGPPEIVARMRERALLFEMMERQPVLNFYAPTETETAAPAETEKSSNETVGIGESW